MKIGELAKAAGCKPVTVRFYERKGLLGAAERSDSNYRVYGAKDLERLIFIRNCRALDLTLAEIQRLTQIQDEPMVDCSQVNACLDAHLNLIEDQITALLRLQQDIKSLRSRCTVPSVSAECGVLSSLAKEPINATF